MKGIYDFIKSFDLHTIIIVGIAFFWLNGSLKSEINDVKTDIAELKRDMVVVKTVLLKT